MRPRDCGDNPYLDYSEISPRLQRLPGPYTLREGCAIAAAMGEIADLTGLLAEVVEGLEWHRSRYLGAGRYWPLGGF